MKPLALLVPFAIALLAPPVEKPNPNSPSALAPAANSVNFKSHLGKYEGCFVLKSLDDGWTLRFNDARCAQRFAPCSTFKIPNAIFGLDCGVLTGPDHPMKWDGTKYWRPEMNRDQTLTSAIKDSVVWYFQNVADQIGAERMQKYVDACNYGNRDISGGIRQFWLQSSMGISADEQVKFLETMYTGKLPLKKEAVEIVRKILVYRTGSTWEISGKTGSGGKSPDPKDLELGWYVGHLKSRDRQYVFAMNISGEGAMGMKAREIVEAIFKDLGLVD